MGNYELVETIGQYKEVCGVPVLKDRFVPAFDVSVSLADATLLEIKSKEIKSQFLNLFELLESVV